MSIPRLTREQAALIGAYTGYALGPFSDVHVVIERVLGRPVYTHEITMPGLMDDVRQRLYPELLDVVYKEDS